MTKNTGIPYEKLAQQVFDQIVNQKGVRTIDVRHNVSLSGKSGISHQIDVYWEFEVGGIRYETVVQAKDWTNPVAQGELLKFKAVLDDLPGQPRGIFVTRTGYQAGAKEYARSHGINLYEMREPLDSDWDGKIKTIVIQMHLFIPNISPVQIIPDNEWIASEKARLALGDDEKITISIKGISSDMPLCTADGKGVGTMEEAVQKLLPEGLKEVSLQKRSYLFSEPTFISTGEPRFPRLKLNGIEANVSLQRATNEIKIDAGEMIGLILKDILTGKEVTFDKKLEPRRAKT